MNSKLKIILPTIFVFLTFLIISFQNSLKAEKLPILGQIPDFQLIDSEGKSFGFKQLKEKVWIADFVFTTCGSICPVLTKNMAALHRTFYMVNSVELVSISVNPDQDSPEVLRQYQKKFTTDAKNWRFLTGETNEIKRLVVEGFKLGSVEDPVFHSDRFVLVDSQGRIRGYYDGINSDGLNAIYKDITILLKEK